VLVVHRTDIVETILAHHGVHYYIGNPQREGWPKGKWDLRCRDVNSQTQTLHAPRLGEASKADIKWGNSYAFWESVQPQAALPGAPQGPPKSNVQVHWVTPPFGPTPPLGDADNQCHRFPLQSLEDILAACWQPPRPRGHHEDTPHNRVTGFFALVIHTNIEQWHPCVVSKCLGFSFGLGGALCVCWRGLPCGPGFLFMMMLTPV
jgi:hypothetical protein